MATRRWVSAILAVLWAGWMLALATGQARRVPGLGSDASERFQHLVAFAILGGLVMAAVRARPLVLWVGLVALGVIGELVQLTTSDRQFSFVDIAMNAVGAAIGIAVVDRFAGRTTEVVVAVLTVTMMVLAPLAPEAVPNVPLTYPEDCGDPPPPSTVRPTAILDEPDLAGVDFPYEIEDPTVADVRAAILETNELTVETWFETTDLTQTGPVRVVTISDGTRRDQVNMHVGIEGDDVSVRLRTSCNIFKWVGAEDAIVADRPQHVAFTWRAATLEIWVDGVKVSTTNNRWGDFARWDTGYRILVGDERGGGRRFEGTVHSVTMWNVALPDDTITERARRPPS